MKYFTTYERTEIRPRCLESQVGIAARPTRRPLRGLLRTRSNLLKHNNLMLRSEQRDASRSMGGKRLTDLMISIRFPQSHRVSRRWLSAALRNLLYGIINLPDRKIKPPKLRP